MVEIYMCHLGQIKFLFLFQFFQLSPMLHDPCMHLNNGMMKWMMCQRIQSNRTPRIIITLCVSIIKWAPPECQHYTQLRPHIIILFHIMMFSTEAQLIVVLFFFYFSILRSNLICLLLSRIQFLGKFVSLFVVWTVSHELNLCISRCSTAV